MTSRAEPAEPFVWDGRSWRDENSEVPMPRLLHDKACSECGRHLLIRDNPQECLHCDRGRCERCKTHLLDKHERTCKRCGHVLVADAA